LGSVLTYGLSTDEWRLNGLSTVRLVATAATTAAAGRATGQVEAAAALARLDGTASGGQRRWRRAVQR